MSALPLISIVVPSYNQGRFLREALDSIFRQEYPRLEVVVMDGGSSDESVGVIRSYESRLRFWRSGPDAGQSAAINEGARHCTGDLLAWLNSDDYYWGDSLWTLARAYAEFPGRGLYIGNGLRYDEDAGRHKPFCPRHLALNRGALLRGLDYVLQPATFFLRKAWEEAQGVDQTLHYCMDWDLILRIGARYSAVLLNEYLAVSREHAETKSSSGKWLRAVEVARMVATHSGREVTPGTLFYLVETLLGMADEAGMRELYGRLYDVIHVLRRNLAEDCGNIDGFPEKGDPQDSVYLPFSAEGPRPPSRDAGAQPSISIVTPSFNQAQFLGQTLESALRQGYPKLELLVFDGGSTDGSVDVLRRYQDRLACWVSEPDRGPASAINKGLARATGDVLGWLNSDDMLAHGALDAVGQAFAQDPEVDMVYGNALYIDERNQLHLADHGSHRTGLYRGEMQPWERIPAYWTYVHAVPQPTVFFRRRLLERCGPLSESYHFIFDFELFWRFAETAKVRKIERTLAFYRIHRTSKTSDWNRFLVELYRFSRPLWPRPPSRRFLDMLRSYVGAYVRRRLGRSPREMGAWPLAALVVLSAVTGVGNPESWPRWSFGRRRRFGAAT